MDEDKRALKDSGTRQTFSTGAVRDRQEGKGRYDLMPMNTLYKLITDPSYWLIPAEVDNDPSPYLQRAVILTIEGITNPTVAENFILRAASEMLNYMEILYRKQNPEPQKVRPIEGWQIHGIFRVARVYEKGAIKYAPRNWEKGIILTRFLDSALRHMFQTASGIQDEDHPAQAAWNLMSFVETKYWIDTGVLPTNLNDMPIRESVGKKLLEESKRLGIVDETGKLVHPGVADVVELAKA